MEPRGEIVLNIASLLRPGGRFILAEANALIPLVQAQMIMKKEFKNILQKTDADGKPFPLWERTDSARPHPGQVV